MDVLTVLVDVTRLHISFYVRFGFGKCLICYFQHLLPLEARTPHIGTCGVPRFCGINWCCMFEPLFETLGVYSIQNPCCYLGCINLCGQAPCCFCLPPKLNKISHGFTKYALEHDLMLHQQDIIDAKTQISAPSDQTMTVELQQSVREHDEQLMEMRNKMLSLEKQLRTPEDDPIRFRHTVATPNPMIAREPGLVYEPELEQEPAIVMDIEPRGADSL